MTGVTFLQRRQTVTVSVGGVTVGSAASDRRAVDDEHRHRRRGRRRPSRWRRSRAAGSQLVRVTVNNDEAAAAVPEIVARARRRGRRRADHRRLPLQRPPAARQVSRRARAALAKYRINPGNVGSKRRDENFRTIVQVAVEHDKPVRIGVNWGSLDQELLTHDDGRERRAGRPARRAGRLHRGDARERAAVGGAGRGSRAARTTGSSSPPRCRRCRIWWRSTAASPRGATTRCTSG